MARSSTSGPEAPPAGSLSSVSVSWRYSWMTLLVECSSCTVARARSPSSRQVAGLVSSSVMAHRELVHVGFAQIDDPLTPTESRRGSGRGDDSDGTGHGLEQNQGLAFPSAWQNDHVRGPVVGSWIDAANELDPVSRTELITQSTQRWF